jgi:rubrerythrin
MTMRNKIVKILIVLSLMIININLFAQKDEKTDKVNVASDKTIKNIKRIINSELQSNDFYTACSAKALKDGYPQISEQFTVIEKMENEHYVKFKELLAKMNVSFKESKLQFVVLSTKDNVNTAYQKEGVAIKVYERAIKQAETDGNTEAAEAFKWANTMEKTHSETFKKILDNFDSYKESK